MNELVDQYNTYHHFVNTKSFNAGYFASMEKSDTNSKDPKCKTIFSKVYTENWSREIFIINIVLKTNPWAYKLKGLNGENVIGSFYEKKLLLIIL